MQAFSDGGRAHLWGEGEGQDPVLDEWIGRSPGRRTPSLTDEDGTRGCGSRSTVGPRRPIIRTGVRRVPGNVRPQNRSSRAGEPSWRSSSMGAARGGSAAAASVGRRAARAATRHGSPVRRRGRPRRAVEARGVAFPPSGAGGDAGSGRRAGTVPGWAAAVRVPAGRCRAPPQSSACPVGRRLQRLDPDPVCGPHVRWMFEQRLAGRTVAGIARELNPRYTGRQVWNRHAQVRREHRGRDAALPSRTTRELTMSKVMAHPPLVSEAQFVAAQQVRARSGRASRRRTAAPGTICLLGSCAAGYAASHGLALGPRQGRLPLPPRPQQHPTSAAGPAEEPLCPRGRAARAAHRPGRGRVGRTGPRPPN
jgi:hypothetical protein